MRSSSFILVVLATCGCTENVGVVETLGCSDPEFCNIAQKCTQICDTLSECPPSEQSCDCYSDVCTCSSTVVSANECLESCSKEMLGRFWKAGDRCKQLGTQVLACFAQLGCAELTQSGGAGPLCGYDAAKAQCPSTNAGQTETPSQANQICTGAGASHEEPSDPSAAGYRAQCTIDLSSCPDGHSYKLSCVESLAGTNDCECIVDGIVRSVFQDPYLMTQSPSAAACNSQVALNQSCGWSLAVAGTP